MTAKANDYRPQLHPAPTEKRAIGPQATSVAPARRPPAAEQTAQGLRAIFAATPLGMLAIGPDGVLRHWNEAFAVLCGWEGEDLTGLDVSEVVPPEVGAEFARLRRTLRDGSDRQCFEVRCAGPEGADVYFRLTAGRLHLDTEGEDGLYAVLEDVSSRRRTEQEMQALELQLRHRQKLEAIGQMAAGIAHEINTPTQYVSDNTVFLKRSFGTLVEALRVCEGLVDAVERGTVNAERVERARAALRQAKVDYLAEQVPRAVEQSLDGLDRITKIVSALKEFSHPSQGEKLPVDLAHAIETTITVARNEWKYVADVETRFDPSLSSVPGMRDELNQVFLNLIVNAAHAIEEANRAMGREKGLIIFETERVGEWAVIRVRDNGIGVPPRIRDKIFNPFFTTKEVGKGTGQGLAISRSVVVDKHGGDLTVESPDGQGATFTIRLPMSSVEDADQEAAA